MILLPAIDIYEGKVVRLRRGDYAAMTVYSADPLETAKSYRDCGAEWLHVVDLEGAKTGETPNDALIERLAAESGLKVEVGGGIRSEAVAARYLEAGVSRVILGTAAVERPGLRRALLAEYGERIAVGVDIRDGKVSIKGWTEDSGLDCFDFCRTLSTEGVRTVIVTDISKDGLLGGTNHELYRRLAAETNLDLVASGGVSTLSDVRALAELGLYGAIVGRALYESDFDLCAAVRIGRGEEQ